MGMGMGVRQSAHSQNLSMPVPVSVPLSAVFSREVYTVAIFFTAQYAQIYPCAVTNTDSFALFDERKYKKKQNLDDIILWFGGGLERVDSQRKSMMSRPSQNRPVGWWKKARPSGGVMCHPLAAAMPPVSELESPKLNTTGRAPGRHLNPAADAEAGVSASTTGATIASTRASHSALPPAAADIEDLGLGPLSFYSLPSMCPAPVSLSVSLEIEL